MVLFTDEDSRNSWHKAGTLTQVVCGIFESHAMNRGYQTELIDHSHDHTYLGIPDIPEEMAHELCAIMNRQFQRRDGMETCSIQQEDLGIFEIYVTKSKDFASLQ